jgi:hypothetical protein
LFGDNRRLHRGLPLATNLQKESYTIQHPATTDTLVDIWGDRVLQVSFRQNPAVMELLDFSAGVIRLRSSAAASFVLKNVANPNWTVDTLINIQRRADRARYVSEEWYQLLRKLMRYSELQNLFPDEQKRSALLLYYESIKNLESCRSNPLFWLQYAISCLVFNELQRARLYFETAYSYADKSNFDPFQIDNHFARYLLLAAIQSGDKATCMDSFRQARETIERQITEGNKFNYPFRVAQLYYRFWDKYAISLKSAEKDEVLRAVVGIIQHIDRLPFERQFHPDVRRCRSNMELVLADHRSNAAQ